MQYSLIQRFALTAIATGCGFVVGYVLDAPVVAALIAAFVFTSSFLVGGQKPSDRSGVIGTERPTGLYPQRFFAGSFGIGGL